MPQSEAPMMSGAAKYLLKSVIGSVLLMSACNVHVTAPFGGFAKSFLSEVCLIHCQFLMAAIAEECTSKDMAVPNCAGVEVIFPATRVARSSLNVFSTPLAWFRGAVYTVTVEQPAGHDNGVDLRTFLWKGVADRTGKWRWKRNLIESRTLDDRYHTGPSIGIDKYGFIHIAYNMHNMPWQYTVSERPGDISRFEFRGEQLTLKELELVKWKNLTPFPRFGAAAIPGTQITYPAFFNDRKGNLYVTYRFATHPKRTWVDRGFAGAIARYDPDKKIWTAIGGPVVVSSADADLPGGLKSTSIPAFAYKDRWSVYLIHLFFDVKNHMHVSWLWRKGGAGVDCSTPGYACSADSGRTFLRADGTRYRLPITPEESDVVVGGEEVQKFYAPTCIATDLSGSPLLLLNPIGFPRILILPGGAKGKWSQPEKTPDDASVIYTDDEGTQWAFATGITVLRRSVGTGHKWRRVYSDPAGDFGYPKILPVPRKKLILVYAQRMDGSEVKIIGIKTGY